MSEIAEKIAAFSGVMLACSIFVLPAAWGLKQIGLWAGHDIPYWAFCVFLYIGILRGLYDES